MSVITCVPEPNLWNEICKEFEGRRPPFTAGLKSIDEKIFINYDARRHSPIFYGDMHAKIDIDLPPEAEFDPAIGHPACIGYAFLIPPQASPCCEPPPPPDKKTCSAREYLEYYIFPILLPAMENVLHTAKTQKCFERKRTKFNALDFLTEYLYKFNPEHCDREDITFCEIPFVKEWLERHPRPPLPKSVLLSEPESILIIQSFWRGYKVRLDESVGELRQWQKDWREGNCNINTTVNEFWANKMPNGTNVSNNNNEEPPCESNNVTDNGAPDSYPRDDNGIENAQSDAPCIDTNTSNNSSSDANQGTSEVINSTNVELNDKDRVPGEENMPDKPTNEPSDLDSIERQPTFTLGTFKKVYSMCDINDIALPYLWQKFDRENYSIWFAEYKYPDELKESFRISNLVAGMYQRLDAMRDHVFGSTIIFATDTDCKTLSTVWIWRSLVLQFQLSETILGDFEQYQWTKLDPDAAETKKLVEEYFTLKGDFGGKKFQEGMIFK